MSHGEVVALLIQHVYLALATAAGVWAVWDTFFR